MAVGTAADALAPATLQTKSNAIEKTVVGLGYELVDVEKGAGGLLCVYIDHPVEGVGHVPMAITVDDCEKVTRQLQHVLEVEGYSYARLEVSSPGLDRALKKVADYRRFAGEQVELTLKEPFRGRKRYRGELQALGDAWRLILASEVATPVRKVVRSIAVEAAGPIDRVLDFSFDEVREARLIPELDFKGRRFASPATGQEEQRRADNGADGGRIQ